jgi:hypothetical protein
MLLSIGNSRTNATKSSSYEYIPQSVYWLVNLNYNTCVITPGNDTVIDLVLHSGLQSVLHAKYFVLRG